MAQRVGRGIALLFHVCGTRRGEWSAARPGRTLPPGKTCYPFYRRLVVPQRRSGRAENHVPTGIRSRTVQPVVQSLYRLSCRTHNFTLSCYSKLRKYGFYFNFLSLIFHTPKKGKFSTESIPKFRLK